MTFKLAEKLKEQENEKLEKVVFEEDVLLDPSGGTLATVHNSLDGPKSSLKRP